MPISNWLVPGRANFEPYGIVPIGLSFRNPNLEVEYQAFTLRVTVVHVRFALVVAMILVASYGILDLLIYKTPNSLLFSLVVRFAVVLPITMFLLLAMAAYQKELISRQLFVSEGRERDALARQYQNDARYLDWLRQLGKFLRHEVRQPVAQINSSIEIVMLACKNDGRLAPYLESASLATQQVWNLVERASQATDAEAYVRLGQLQRTDLRVLLTEQVEAFGRVNSGIDLQLQCPTAIVADADPILIKEAIGNLLSNAASFAQEGSTVKVVLEMSGVYAAIRVINKGPTIEGDTEMLFGPFTSTRANLASEHQGLGLYLVRLIAQQHGGMATISNLNDNSGVAASILLPHSA
jgi:signal transduction histidine kinase